MQKTTAYEKKYCMTLKGNVQDVGFRGIIKDTADDHYLDGEVFNHPDGDVVVRCGGKNGDISNFLEDIKVRGSEDDIVFEIVEKIELPSGFRFPKGFYIIDTDTPEDEQRKLEKGLGDLRSIKKDVHVVRNDISNISNNASVIPEIVKNTSVIPEIVKNTSVIPEIVKNTSVLPGLIEGQNKMLDILERIAGKL